MKNTILALMAALILPSGMSVEAARPKKSAHKTSVKASAKKRSAERIARLKATSASKSKQAEKPQDTVVETPMLADNIVENSGNVSGETIVKTAMQYIGVPYRHGTSSPKSFDCSGFTSYVYRQFDITLSRCSSAQYAQGRIIRDKSQLRAGDLVFFQGRSGRGGVGHVGIVIETNPSDKSFKFVHARSRGVGIDDSKMAYYSSRYVGARRILTDDTEN